MQQGAPVGFRIHLRSLICLQQLFQMAQHHPIKHTVFQHRTALQLLEGLLDAFARIIEADVHIDVFHQPSDVNQVQYAHVLDTFFQRAPKSQQIIRHRLQQRDVPLFLGSTVLHQHQRELDIRERFTHDLFAQHNAIVVCSLQSGQQGAGILRIVNQSQEGPVGI